MTLSFSLDRTVRKPDFVGLYPQNVTIMEGSTARLQCRVISDTPLFLQWLKRLDRLSPYEAHRQAVGGVEHGRPDSDGVLQVRSYCLHPNAQEWHYILVASSS